MIVDITYKCSMGCSHCMSDCKPDGQHMTLATFDKVIDFLKRYNYADHIILSGGEIFEHPHIDKILTIVDCHFQHITLITNGDILSTDRNMYNFVDEIRRKRPKRSLMIQITNDAKYYPKVLTQKQLYKLNKLGAYIGEVPSLNGQQLYPQGRALINHKDANWFTVAPKCINSRLLVNQGYTNFKSIIKTLISIKKLCNPIIAPDGSIKLGESALCPACAHIDDDNDTIIDKIRNFKCYQCSIAIDRLKQFNPLGYSLFMGDTKNA